VEQTLARGRRPRQRGRPSIRPGGGPGPAAGAIPALERAIRILETVEASPGGVTPQGLLALGVPRTSLYRMLEVMADAGLLAATPGVSSTYTLGPAIRRMASRMPSGDDLAARAHPVLRRLAVETGETVKIVLRDGLETVAIAVAHPGEDSRVAARVGARLPLHVGAGQRLLLSRAPPEVIESVLARPLQKRGLETIVDPERLRRNLSTLRRREWALGRNEGASGVGSIGALVHEAGYPPRSALVLLYILSGRRQSEVLRMRDRVVAAAQELSTQSS